MTDIRGILVTHDCTLSIKIIVNRKILVSIIRKLKNRYVVFAFIYIVYVWLCCVLILNFADKRFRPYAAIVVLVLNFVFF